MTQIEAPEKRRISWYRTKIDRSLLAQLNQRSDFWGLAQTLGYLGTLTATGAIAWYVSAHLSWPWFVLALFVHGTGYAFIINGFHELVHSSGPKCRSRRPPMPRNHSKLGITQNSFSSASIR